MGSRIPNLSHNQLHFGVEFPWELHEQNKSHKLQ